MAESELEVDASETGLRLDVFLVRRLTDMTRKKARELTSSGKVRVNGRLAPRGRLLSAGDRVLLEEQPTASAFVAEPDPDLPLRIAHEDARVVVVDKEPGVPSHPLRSRERGTVSGALLARYPEMERVGYGPREPGILHRLDTDTSGLIVAARDPEAFVFLREALRAGRFEKRYRALCAGQVPAPRIVDFPIAAHPKDARRVVACTREVEVARLRARPAETEVLASELAGPCSLVEVRARTARRHQVRAHLAALGHPLAGDRIYGGPSVPGLSRHFLHASMLAFPHPDGGTVEVISDLPRDIRCALDTVREQD